MKVLIREVPLSLQHTTLPRHQMMQKIKSTYPPNLIYFPLATSEKQDDGPKQIAVTLASQSCLTYDASTITETSSTR